MKILITYNKSVIIEAWMPKMKFLSHLGTGNTINDLEKGHPRPFLTSAIELENRGL